MLRPSSSGFQFLCIQRSRAGRCPGSWESVHGSIEAGESPVDAARRELREETGLEPERLYNLSRVESFYLHRRDLVSLIPVFCAIVTAGSAVTLSDEHDDHAWLSPDDAKAKFGWPRERRAVDDVMQLFGSGTAGKLEDVLRVS